MEINLEIDSEVVILKLAGDLKADSAGKLQETVTRLTGKNYLYILFDMSRVELIDSTGLGICSSINRELASKNGALACSGLTENVQRIFRLTRLDQRLPVFDTRIDGVSALLAKIQSGNA